MKKRMGIVMTLMLVVTVVLTACGGGGGGGGTAAQGPSPKPVLSSGVMAKGSVIVNGIRFEDTLANITADDTAKLPATILQNGMVVKVKGTRNDDGVTGTAEKIEVENEVRGTISSVGTGSFSVLGQTVIVSSTTITAGGWSYDAVTGAITGLSVSNFVEVHGSRNTAGAILATRVEKFGAAGDDELRGIVSGLTGTFALNDSFTINGFTITTSGSTTVVPAAPIVNGTLVEVHLTGNLATRIEVEDAEDAEFEPAEGQEVEIEGYISNYDNISDFEISGQHVHLSASTRYEGGIYADLANDVKVEAEGHMSSGILIADKIKFKDTIRFEANADANGSAGVLGRTIYVVASTEYKNLANAAAIAVGDGLRVRGYLNSDGSTITATRVEKLSSPVATNKKILQGPVNIKDEANKKLTILGITVDLNAVPANEIKDDSDTIIPLSQFYSLITLNKTAVKVRGSYSVGNFTADKAEIE